MTWQKKKYLYSNDGICKNVWNQSKLSEQYSGKSTVIGYVFQLHVISLLGK